ncbi:MAG: hypothetical protein JWQ74_3548 [Marmoricola sp.]|nr:hypothetical protein [Marmoricola sp.]
MSRIADSKLIVPPVAKPKSPEPSAKPDVGTDGERWVLNNSIPVTRRFEVSPPGTT